MKRKTGLGPTREWKTSLGGLKSKYENSDPKDQSYRLAKSLIEENIPDSLKALVDILARAVAKMIRKKQLRITCNMIAKLIVHVVRSNGYNCEKVVVYKDFNSGRKNIFIVKKHDISCPKKEIWKIKRMLSDLYGLNIEFGSPPKGESFFIPTPL